MTGLLQQQCLEREVERYLVDHWDGEKTVRKPDGRQINCITLSTGGG